MNRREFLGGAAAFAAGGLVSGGCVTLGDRSRMKLGVLSDVHIRVGGTQWVRKAFAYFRDAGADAVMVTGDIADFGRVGELKSFAEAWTEFFPNDRAPDGRPVKKLFIYGNHDIYGWKWDHTKAELKDPDVIADAIGYDEASMARVWEQCFDEQFEPIWIKEVKGFKFVGAHWGIDKNDVYPWRPGGEYAWAGGRLKRFLAAHDAELRGPLPFFYAQHAHPANTCNGSWAWGHDCGSSTEALSAYPNAVAFSGHSHYTLVDERSIWQGAFTSINAGSMINVSRDYNLRDTAYTGGNDWGYRGWDPKHISPGFFSGDDGHQGLFVEIGDGEIVLHRRDFTWGESLGEDWVIPYTVRDGRPYDPAARLKARTAPEFAEDARLRVQRRLDKKHGEVVDVVIPRAQDAGGCRVFEYEVTAHLLEDDVDLVVAQNRVLDRTYYLPLSKVGRETVCSFKVADLPAGGHLRFEVRPLECFGKKGLSIQTEIIKL